MLSGIPTTYDDGTKIFSEGDPAADMYLIVSGRVKIMRETDGSEFELASLDSGDFFGEMALFSPGPRSATAVAVGTVEVEVVDRTAFLDAVGDPMVRQIMQKMSERLRQMDTALSAALQAQEFTPEQP